MRDGRSVADEAPRRIDLVDSGSEDFAAASAGAIDDRIVFGVLAKSDFDLARPHLIDLCAHFDYDDWLDLRLGAQVALSWAGVESVSVPIAAPPLLQWCKLTRQRPSEASLDAFAAIAWALENGRDLAVFACVGEADFSRHVDAIPAFAEVRDYATWSRRRAGERARAARKGQWIENLPVRAADFEAWRACVGEAGDERALDAYARLRLEQLTLEATTVPINPES